MKDARDILEGEGKEEFHHINAAINFINNCIGEVPSVFQATLDLFEISKQEDYGQESND